VDAGRGRGGREGESLAAANLDPLLGGGFSTIAAYLVLVAVLLLACEFAARFTPTNLKVRWIGVLQKLPNPCAHQKNLQPCRARRVSPCERGARLIPDRAPFPVLGAAPTDP
jgi:hypothetical protein